MNHSTEILRDLEFQVLKMEDLVQSIIATCPRDHETLPLLIDLRETLDVFEIEFFGACDHRVGL